MLYDLQPCGKVTHEALKAVFPLLDGVDLASCMLVCKQWKEIVQDDYFWKCSCARRWPSICKRSSSSSSSMSYYKLYQTFYKRQRCRDLLPPKLSFNDLEFYIDIWLEEQLIFSEVVPGSVFLTGIKDPPTGISGILRYHLKQPDFKMMFPVPIFPLPVCQIASISMLASRKDTDKFACIINKALFDYVDRTSYRAHASDYLEFSPAHPFISGIRAWISLLLTDKGSDEQVDVFGIEMDFCDVASTEVEALLLLDMLDWK